MVKILNLDELPNDTVEREIIWKGEKHKYVPLTMDQFIERMRLMEKRKAEIDAKRYQLAKEAEMTVEEFTLSPLAERLAEFEMSTMIEDIRNEVAVSFPTLKPHIPNMRADQVMSIFTFMQETAEDQIDKTVEDLKKQEEIVDNAGNP